MTRPLITLLGVVMTVALVPTVSVATAAQAPTVATGSPAAVESCLSAAGLELATGETPTISGAEGIGGQPRKGTAHAW